MILEFFSNLNDSMILCVIFQYYSCNRQNNLSPEQRRNEKNSTHDHLQLPNMMSFRLINTSVVVRCIEVRHPGKLPTCFVFDYTILFGLF